MCINTEENQQQMSPYGRKVSPFNHKNDNSNI